MSTPKKPPQWPKYVGAIFVIIFLIMGLKACTDSIAIFFQDLRKTQSAPPTPPQPATPIVVSERAEISVIFKITKTICLDVQKVDYSLVDVLISGGLLPYRLLIENSQDKILGPYDIDNPDRPVELKIYGGDFFKARIQSSDSKHWIGTIAIPLMDPVCRFFVDPTATATPTVTLTPTFTLTSTKIGIISLPTSTRRGDTNNNWTATVTINVEPSTTPNLRPTNTSVVINPTNTSRPSITDTPVVINPTNTSRPSYTNTPVVNNPTDTPKPPPAVTNTPINPNPRECEDGIDNDGDNLIDFPNDPECKKASDTHEGK